MSRQKVKNGCGYSSCCTWYILSLWTPRVQLHDFFCSLQELEEEIALNFPHVLICIPPRSLILFFSENLIIVDIYSPDVQPYLIIHNNL